MGGWGETKGSGSVGTTRQIEEAHRELDKVGIMPGPLAIRAEKAARLVGQFMELERNRRTGKKHTVDL